VEWPDEDLFEKDRSAGKHFRLEKERHDHTPRKSPKPVIKGRKKSSADKPAPAKKPVRHTKPHVPKKHRDAVPAKLQQKLKTGKRKSPQRTHEERMEYYRKKYGENFKPVKDRPADTGQTKKKSLLKKFLGLFIND